MSDATAVDGTRAVTARPAATRRRARGPGGMSPRVGWLFILPNLLGFGLFTLIPLLSGLAIAFTDWDVVSGLEGLSFVGLANFTELAADPAFWSAVRRTLTYAGFGVPLTMIGGMALALALNGEVPGRAALRVIFFIPHIVSSIAIGFVWLLLLNPSSGLINLALRTIGISEPPTWLVSQEWSLPSLILIAIWSGVGFHAVIYLSALQSMPADLHEAAAIDGAGPLRRFVTVTWRSLMPTTTFLLITSMISQSQGFGLIAFLTQGGPGDSSTTMSYLMYQNGFQFYRFGYAAAIGVTSFVGVLILSVLFWRLQRNQGLYS
ncbi:carbohydrate ABC transporter permease [Microlunatus parietis]|uniref:ABC-type sugar transport system permease subunit n=1 Tax=Microlunatus parietis TaxID=682979 RepID=A0A7Y9L9L6_9ACTN|nr:sugar ABC transporter permease [Microlunatus parietis]NYE69722.1 ABC-type sugar transport system permease subunit [Microlunatus parietis]